MGTLIEHYAGALPVWLSPVQVSVLPVLDKSEAYARKVLQVLLDNRIRAEVVGSQQKLGYRIREKTLEKVPYIVVVGNREEAGQSVSVRKRGVGDKGTMGLDEFVRSIRGEIDAKTLEQ